ncbi:MAG: CPBP family intramembrane metalloprotease [Candidatus Thorarchaeota archaeon]|nr:CPBP family intramembrane metalloprotease [Candidatus Thorarchaeota archaeon]
MAIEVHNEEASTSGADKAAAVLEVIFVRFVIYGLLALWLVQLMCGTPTPNPFPIEAAYTVGALWFVVPFVLIYGLRRNAQEYGLSTQSSRQSIDLALSAFPYMILAENAVMMLLITIGWSYLEPQGALVLTASFTLALLLIVRMVSRKYSSFHDIQIPDNKHSSNVLVILLLLCLPIGLGIVPGKLSLLLVSTVVWQFVISGFGEEVFFRGYIQSRLNAAFGRPYEWKGIRFGAGLFMTAALFGITHMLNTANIWLGDFNLAWWWGTFTFVGGLLLGLLREKTGSVLAPATLHGLEAVGEGLALLF